MLVKAAKILGILLTKRGAGVDIPKQKRGVISLTYIYGVGRSRAKDILATVQKQLAHRLFATRMQSHWPPY